MLRPLYLRRLIAERYLGARWHVFAIVEYGFGGRDTIIERFGKHVLTQESECLLA